jgi:hypothetical protein
VALHGQMGQEAENQPDAASASAPMYRGHAREPAHVA